MLADGKTIYHDSPQNVIPFFKKLGKEFGKYKNPADQLLKLANDPKSFDMDMPSLLEQTKDFWKNDEIRRYTGTGYRKTSVVRRANICRQFWYLSCRNVQFYARNPMGLLAMVLISFFSAGMMSQIFQGVGLQEIQDPREIKGPIWKKKGKYQKMMADNMRVSKDYLGFIFFCATDQFLSIAIG